MSQIKLETSKIYLYLRKLTNVKKADIFRFTKRKLIFEVTQRKDINCHNYQYMLEIIIIISMKFN